MVVVGQHVTLRCRPGRQLVLEFDNDQAWRSLADDPGHWEGIVDALDSLVNEAAQQARCGLDLREVS